MVINCEEQLPFTDCWSMVGRQVTDRFFGGTVFHFYRINTVSIFCLNIEKVSRIFFVIYVLRCYFDAGPFRALEG